MLSTYLLPFSQSEVLYQYLCFQKLCPGHFLIPAPWPHDFLDEEEIEDLKGKFIDLMPLDSMVMDLWDIDIHFEGITFENNFFEVACGTDGIVDQAAVLCPIQPVEGLSREHLGECT